MQEAADIYGYRNATNILLEIVKNRKDAMLSALLHEGVGDTRDILTACPLLQEVQWQIMKGYRNRLMSAAVIQKRGY